MKVPSENGAPGRTMGERSVVHVPQRDEEKPTSVGAIVTTEVPAVKSLAIISSMVPPKPLNLSQ